MQFGEFHARFHEINETPFGAGRAALCESLLRDTLVAGPQQMLPQLYMALVEAYTFGDEPRKAIVTFAKLLRLLDTSPELFDSEDEKSVFWQFKWIVGSAVQFTELSKAQLEAMLDDMERRFQLAGHGLMAPRIARFEYAATTGQPNAEQLRRLWLATPEDEFNECPACVIGTQLNFFLLEQRYEELVELGKQQVHSCNVEPHHTHLLMMLAYLHLEQPQLAAEHLELAIATHDSAHGSNSPYQISGVLMETLARSGHLEAFLRCLKHIEGPKTNAAKSRQLTLNDFHHRVRLVAALTALFAQGVDRATPSGLHSPELATLGAVYDSSLEQAERTAQIFDARNENSMLTQLLQRACNARPAAAPLPAAAAALVH